MRLKLQGGILIQPLTSQQIDAYLTSMGDQLQTLSIALIEDEGLRELVQAPLMLSVMTLAYPRTTADGIETGGTIENYRQRLFDAYVERIFLRRGQKADYTLQQTRKWLIWLAVMLKYHNQTILYIERLQPSWLPLTEICQA
jgi:hypothetical protein